MTDDKVPLVVDLDGTLIVGDTLIICFKQLCRTRPFSAAIAPLWLVRGRAGFKRRVVAGVTLDATRLRYRPAVVDFVRSEKAIGRPIVLATAADQTIADAVAAHFAGLFDHVLGTTPTRNLKGTHKLAGIRENLGDVFDYIGDSSADLPIFKAARRAILVAPSAKTLATAKSFGNVDRVLN